MLPGIEGERDPGELYTVEAAARVLERTPSRVRQLLRSGDLEGEHEGGDLSKPWRVYAWSVHAYRDAATRGGACERREGTARSPRAARERPETGPDMLRVVQDLQRELGCLEGRLELTAQAESTAREDLERERARAHEERRRANEERERAEDLRRELEAERGKGFGPGCSGDDGPDKRADDGGTDNAPLRGPGNNPMHAFGNTLMEGPESNPSQSPPPYPQMERKTNHPGGPD